MTEDLGNYDNWKTATPPYLEGNPERLEAFAQAAFELWAKDNVESIKNISRYIDSEMREAWARGGGCASDCDGFTELHHVIDAMEAAVAPKGQVKPWTGIRNQ